MYITPETVLGRWKSKLKTMHSRVGIKLIAVDEAHCVAEWGHDFRPQYQQLIELRDVIPDVPIMALTATATPSVRQEIIQARSASNTPTHAHMNACECAHLWHLCRFSHRTHGARQIFPNSGSALLSVPTRPTE